MMKFDLEEVAALLHIHEKATGYPKLKPIADAAMKHLEELSTSMLPKPEPIEEAPVEPETEDPSAQGSG
jgi:hypothetical protein